MRLHLLSTSLRLTLITALLAPTPAVLAYDRVTGQDFASRSEVIAPHAMAATSQPLATQIALDIMKQGGNAIDAAIAANAALGLMEPTGNGIGGDLYAIVWSAQDKKLFGLNGSGRSPKGICNCHVRSHGFHGSQGENRHSLALPRHGVARAAIL